MCRTRLLVAFSIVTLLVLAPAILSAQSKSPKDRPPPISTVTKVDGTTVKGTIVSADPDNVTVRPLAKAGEEPEPIVIAWTEIKKLSNGLTREKAWAQWKDANRANLCVDCKGDRTVHCGECKGAGHDPLASKDCKMCKGEVLVECKNTKCDEGKSPCPEPCLKLSEGQWTNREGKKWRKFPTRGGGSFLISEGHLGEVVRMVNGDPVNQGKCTRCAGTTIADCVDCDGVGKQICKTCLAMKDAPDCTVEICEEGRLACETCKETGLKT